MSPSARQTLSDSLFEGSLSCLRKGQVRSGGYRERGVFLSKNKDRAYFRKTIDSWTKWASNRYLGSREVKIQEEGEGKTFERPAPHLTPRTSSGAAPTAQPTHPTHACSAHARKCLACPCLFFFWRGGLAVGPVPGSCRRRPVIGPLGDCSQTCLAAARQRGAGSAGRTPPRLEVRAPDLEVAQTAGE